MLRSTVCTRMDTTPGWAPGTVPYVMDTADCRAYVCDVLGIHPWQNTAEVVASGTFVRISDWNDLKPGDLVGVMGPGTEGANGHMAFFDGWLNDVPQDNRCYVWQQSGGRVGPTRDLVDPPAEGWLPYRWVGIEEDAPAPIPPTPEPAPERRFEQVVPFEDGTPDYRSTLWGIATHYGKTVEELAELNGISDPNLIFADQVNGNNTIPGRIYIDPA